MHGSATDELPIGRRVAYWRGRRGMSQQQFADAIGKSKSWVDKVERGVRALDKLSSLQAIADGLRVDLRLLLGKDAEREAGSDGLPDRASIDALRGVLARWGPVQLGRGQSTPTLSDLGKAVDHAGLACQHARYADLVRSLPKLLLDAQQVRAANPGAPEAAQRLAEAYRIASAVMRKAGINDLAWMAADRALTASQDADDPFLTGACAAQFGYTLLAQGQARHAVEIGIAVAHQIAPPSPLDAPPDQLSVYGTLLIVAALGAAALGHADSVAELVGQAGEAAEIVGDGQDHYRTAFGPVTVELARMATAVELGTGAVDPAAHQRLIEGTAFRRLPPERRAAYLLDAANGFMQTGDLTTAGQALVSADRVAPAEVRNRPLGHELLATLLRRSPAASLDVLRLADEIGVVV
ncbi:Helix-turn-helix protein [Micromonospora sp. MW-13]|uniref:helix-turn-helix domain-containing protein n=1 Tax=Micromonospora sp. MW-13 TaxID=2094022 RepID=UPI000EE47FCF|nr:helix-turn-helix domain-containing protein [Micromonospora sp. MW-13]RGC67957.1 Helix-turn-helix protein [Micromonospora sp. MW-13]